MSDQVWVQLDEGVSIGIERAEAMALDRKGFARLYRKHRLGSKRREANVWADEQIRLRAAAREEGADTRRAPKTDGMTPEQREEWYGGVGYPDP